jgi:hypothetical protein
VHAFLSWRDWPDLRDWLGVTATAAAAWFAAWTIRQSHRLALRATSASLLERRVDHELSVLRAVSEAIARNQALVIGGLINMTGLTLPMIRAAFNLDPSTAEAAIFESRLREAMEQDEVDVDVLKADVTVWHHVRLQYAQRIAMQEISEVAKELVAQRPSISGASRPGFWPWRKP